VSAAGDRVTTSGRRRRPSDVWAGLGLVLLSTAIFGVTPSLVTFSRGELSVIEMVAYRTALASLLFLVLARLHRAHVGLRSGPVRVGPTRGILIGAILWGPQVILYYASFAYIDTSLAVAIGFLYPTLVLLLASAARRRRPGRSDVGLSLLALLGIAALLLPGSDAGVHPLGVALAALAAGGYAVYVLLADSLLREADIFEVGAQVSVGAALSAITTGLVLGNLSVLTSRHELLVVSGQAVLLVAATGCYYGGLIRLGSTQASLVDTAQPAVALLAGAALLGERMVAVQLVGVALVTASVAISSALAHRRATVPYADPP
jgi:drug/metabolite transporter (DMT)-like permease